MKVAIKGPAISLTCPRQIDFFHFLLCLLQLPFALATKTCNFCSFLSFTASFPFLLVLFLRRSVWMIDNSRERTFLQLLEASRSVLPLDYGPLGPRSNNTSIRHGVQRMSDFVHRSLVGLFGHAMQASLHVERFDVQSPRKPRFLRRAIKP